MPMLNVNHAIVSADGSIQSSTFRLTHTKYESFQTKNDIHKFLRTKMIHKGNHLHWKSYGSWTLTHDDGTQTYIYAWAFLKGNKKHKYSYVFEENTPCNIYDDLLLLHLPVDNIDQIPLQDTIALTTDHITDWLECVLQKIPEPTASINIDATPDENTSVNVKANTKKKKRSKSSKKPQKPSTMSSTKKDDPKHVLDNNNEDIGDVLDDSDEENNSDDESIDEEEEQNMSDIDIETDDEDGVNQGLLLDDDEEDEEDIDLSENEEDKMSDDDDESETEIDNQYDDNVLVFENYTYTQPIYKKTNTLLSMWTRW